MAINGLIISSGATVSSAGGTAVTYNVDGQVVANGVHVSDLSVVDFKLRPGITFKARMPQRRADGTWQKGKFSATLTRPKLKADGKVDFPLARAEIEFLDESTQAEMLELRKQLAQLVVSTLLNDFWNGGSKA